MPVQIIITSDSPAEAGLELMALTEALRGRPQAEPTRAEPARTLKSVPKPQEDPQDDDDDEPPAARMKTPPKGGRPKKITKDVEQGKEDRIEAAQAVPDTDKEISEDVVKAKMKELIRLMGPAKANSWFKGAFQVAKFSDLDPADYVTVVRTIEQRLTKLIEDQEQS